MQPAVCRSAGKVLLAVSGGRCSAMGGGVPFTSEGQVIAGVGVSGGTTEQDIAIVEATMGMSRPTEPVAAPVSVDGLSRRQRAGLQLTFLGTGFGDMFKTLRGGSKLLERGMRTQKN